MKHLHLYDHRYIYNPRCKGHDIAAGEELPLIFYRGYDIGHQNEVVEMSYTFPAPTIQWPQHSQEG